MSANDIISVSNAQELRAALNTASGGETIKLAGGDYGQLDLITFTTFGVKAIYDSPVTITSADPGNRASFSGMDLRQVENLTFDNVVFDSNYTGSETWASPFSVRSSSGITIRDSLFEGELALGTGDPTADGFATGKGLRIHGSSDILIENNEFTTWFNALDVGGVTDVRVIGNDIHSSRSEGMNFSGVRNVLIEDNHIHDFVRSKASGDHSDMIQFWTYGGSRSSDIIIRGNTLDVGKGDGTQSLFMRNEAVDNGAGEDLYYQNMLIEENVILNNHTHGISVGATNGLIIRKNSVLDADAANSASVMTPRISVSSEATNVVIEQNATAAIKGQRDQPDWSVSGNALVQNTDFKAPGYYESEFLNSSMSGVANEYIVDPSGTITQFEAGASRLRLDTSPDSLRPAFDVSKAPDAANSLVFDAAHTYGAAGNITASDAQFIWDFGDGTGATGQLVRHTYADAGRYDATLMVVTPAGAKATAESKVVIMGEDMLSFDQQTGFFQAEGYGEGTAIAHSDRALVVTDGGYGIDLGGDGVAVGVSKSQIARFFGAESFDMSMTLRADTLGSTGEVARVHANFDLSVVNRGEVAVRLGTDSGAVKLTTTGVTVNDGNDHDIRIALDSASSRLEIHVDGALVAATDVEGAVRADFPRNLDFGNPWSNRNFDGILTAFDLDVGNQDYPDYPGDLAAIPSESLPLEDLPSADSSLTDPTDPVVPLSPAPPAFDVSKAPDAANSLVFDAAHTYGAAGNITASDAQFIWDFGDGTGATGQLVRHTYADAGRYDATLMVVTPAGAKATAESKVVIMGEDMLSFDQQTGFFQAEGYGEATAIAHSDRALVVTDGGYGIDLGGDGVAVGVSKSQIARFFGAESFDMSMTLRADTLGSTGEVARVHANFDLSVVNRGEVAVRLETDSGAVKLTTTGVTVNDGNDHDIRIALDSASNRLEIHVDGALVAATDVEGAVRADFPRNLDFGNPWGHKNFDGLLTAFDLDVGNQDYPDYPGDLAAIPSESLPLEDLPSADSSLTDPTDPVVPLSPAPLAPEPAPTSGEQDTQDQTESSEHRTEVENSAPESPGESVTVQADLDADRLRLDTSPDSLRPAFDVSKAPDAANSLVFDAAHTYGAAGNITASDAQFIWDFGDGTGATGQLVRHTYADAGRYDATLMVVTPAGAKATAESKVVIMGEDMLSFDQQTGFFQAEGYGEGTAIAHSDRALVVTDGGYGIDLGGDGVAVGVSKSQIARFFGAESFDMSMTLRADTLGSTGEVARVHANFDLSVVNRGEVAVRLGTDSGAVKLTTTGVTVNDGNDHDIRIALDSASSRLEIHVDGALVAATDVEGAVRADFPRNLDFGNPWGHKNFDGLLTAFDLDVGNQDYPDYPGDLAAIPSESLPLEDLPSADSSLTDPTDPVVPLSPAPLAPEPAPTSGEQDTQDQTESSEHRTEVENSAPESPGESVTVQADLDADRLEVAVEEDVEAASWPFAPDVVSLTGSALSGLSKAAQAIYADDRPADAEEGDAEVFVEEAQLL